MDHLSDALPDEQAPAPPPGDRGQQQRTRGLVLALRTAIVVALIALVLVGIDYATSVPELCGSCHAMKARAASWAESTHTEVACVSCHQPPTEWYALPQRLFSRARLLGRDIGWQISGRAEESTEQVSGGVGSVSSDNCLECHDPNRQATSGFRILIDHAEHAERNETCLSCHVNTAHPEPTRGTPLSLMDRCFACHGTAEQPDASAECDVCHPKDYELVPTSHEPANWKREGHGRLATRDPGQCELCHKTTFCTDCHGLEMPHPSGWAQGEPATHSLSAEQDREVCGRCHLERPDLCSMCHHQDWDPGKGPWVTQHPPMVSKRGVDYCLRCHTRAHCSFCHVASLSSMATTATN